MERNLTKMLVASAMVVVLPTIALAQAVLSDQKDALAHMTNALLAAEQSEMRVDQEILDATMGQTGLAKADIETEPYRSAFAAAAQEARTTVDAFGRQTSLRPHGRYGATGVRVPRLLAR